MALGLEPVQKRRTKTVYHVYIYIYIYIPTERERERERVFVFFFSALSIFLPRGSLPDCLPDALRSTC